MDHIELPLIPASASLRESFDRMADSGAHAAIVMRLGGEPFLIHNTALDAAFEQGIARIGQVEGIPLHPVQADMEGWEGALDAAGASYGIVMPEAAGGLDNVDFGDEYFAEEGVGYGHGPPVARRPRVPATVTMVTRHESFAEQIRTSGVVCRCTGAAAHRGEKNKPCQFCGSSVRCA